MEDISHNLLPADEVEKIAILDIRLMNGDRNVTNLLVRQDPNTGNYNLVPIDHGYALRSKCDVACFDWCWYEWPQLKNPISKKARKYIHSLDIEKDANLLKTRLGLDDDAIKHFKASNYLLKAGVSKGLTLFEVSCLFVQRLHGYSPTVFYENAQTNAK